MSRTSAQSLPGPVQSNASRARVASKSQASKRPRPSLHAPSPSTGDQQLAQMQSIDALLSEFFPDILQQQRHSKQRPRVGDRGESLDGSTREAELTAETKTKIAKVCAHYEHCMQELSSVERHLLQAKARALTGREKTLSERKQALCGYESVSLPPAESTLGSLLNKELLEKNHLLHPTHYISPMSHTSTPTLSSSYLHPPRETTPTYLQPTFTSTQHISTSSHTHTHTGPVPSTQELSWKDQPSPTEREADRKALARLRQRGDYLCNPRYSSQLQPNTSSHGAIRRRDRWLDKTGQTVQPLPKCTSDRKMQLFMAEPKEVVFTDYQVGHTYQETVNIKNVSGCSRQMRIIPLNSPYFTVTRGVSTHPEGLIAPGMHVTCTITFTPSSLYNYREEIKIQSHSGQCVIIPVVAVRPPPRLSLPETIDCGSCLAGGSMHVLLKVENTGGEGRFSISHTDTHQSEGVLQLGPFSLSPTELHLTHNDSTTLQVTFSPGKEGKYGEYFTIECDNGEAITFGLTGVADVVSVGCVYIGHSSPQEISRLTSSSASTPYGLQVDPLMSNITYELYTEQLEECNVVFDTVNPHTPSYKTVVIRNYSNVDLPFHWKLFRPLTELQSSDGEDPVVSSLVPSTNSPFSMLPSSGTLPASSCHAFLCQFLPPKTGEFVDAVHLLLSHVPSASLPPDSEGETWRRVDSDISCVCLFLTATAQPYVLEMQPPAILLPAAIPLATDIRQRVKMVSHSVSTLHYNWRQLPSHEGVTITPASGSIVSGGGAYCEVVIGKKEEGEFSLHLVCDIEHSSHPATLPLHGWTQGPQVSMDCTSLQFGLIRLGTSSQLTLTLTSHTNTSVTVCLRQAVRENSTVTTETTVDNGDNDKIVDHACLHFTPSAPLILPPHSVTTVTVECRPLVASRLRSMAQCLMEDKVIQCVSVHAEVQRPAVTLAQCRLHEDTVYVGVGTERRVAMINTSLIPTHFTWSKQVLGSSSGHCSVAISPLSGSIGPRETIPVTLTATWDTVGLHPETVLHCNVDGMREPLLLALSAEVHGLAVNYSVQERSTADDTLSLEYGTDNALFTPHTLHLLVTNTTAIPAHLTTHIHHFPPSHSTPPHHHPPSTQKKSILSRTVNIGDPNSKTPQQANKEYVHGLLRDGRGCCFVVDPPSSPLLPFTTHTLTITAYSDMWGDYHDKLICQVSGLDAVEVPIHCGVTGCPLIFHSTAQPQHSLVRFGSHSADSQPVQRLVRINNTSPEEIRVDWQMYNIVHDDRGLVDFITTIGPPFPRHTASHAHTRAHPVSPSPPPQQPDLKQRPGSGLDSGHSDDGMELGHGDNGMESGHSNTGERDGGGEAESDQEPVVRVFLRGHEGVRADRPFSVDPAQMIVPARGQNSVTVKFHPSLQGGMDPNQSGYCLGHISLDHQSLISVHRVTGYELAPLRVDLEASVERPRLHMEADTDHGLHFTYPASMLLQEEQVLSRVSKTHHVTLINLTASILSFTLSSSSPHFTITTPSTPPSPCHTLSPHTPLSVGVMFHLSQVELKGCTLEKIIYSAILLVQFSTGAIQEFPLSAEVIVPHVSVSAQEVELGQCLLNHSLSSSSLTLCNTTPSELPWTLNPTNNLSGVVGVSPSSGVLPPHLNADRPSSQHILLTFTPDAECAYTGCVVVTEVLTGCETNIAVTASGITDEVHKTMS